MRLDFPPIRRNPFRDAQDYGNGLIRSPICLNFGWHGAFDSRSLTSFSNNFRPLARALAASGGFFRLNRTNHELFYVVNDYA
jgi:hypothetical protein